LRLGEAELLLARLLHLGSDRTAGKVYGDHGAAVILAMKPSTLQRRMKRLGMLTKNDKRTT